MPGHSNIVGGFLTQKKYAKNASDDRVQGLQNADSRIRDAQKSLTEYRDYGKESINRQNRLFEDPSYLENTGGYKFTQEQGLKGTTAARSRSSIFSGETLKALTEYAAGLAQQTYGAEWDRFQKGIDTGMAAEAQYGNLSSTSAEIQAGIGEARAREHDQNAANLAGEIGFGRQIFGQWSSAFASSTASSAGSCWVAEVLYGTFAKKTLTTRAFVQKHMQDKTPLGRFCRLYSKYGRTWASLIAKYKFLRTLALPIWDKLYNRAAKEAA